MKGRTAFITGASSGIGREIAIRFAKDGGRVVVVDVREDPKSGERYDTDVSTPTHEIIQTEHDTEALFIETDVSAEEQVKQAVTKTADEFGGIDILVNNAGIHIPGSSQDLSKDDWDSIVGVNLDGYFLTTKYAIPHLIESDLGRIVNVSSINAKFGGIGPAYAATKAGIVNLTRDIAIELAAENVTVNAVLPGVIKTPLQDLNDDDVMDLMRQKTPLPRLGEPRDIANAVRFFASPEAEWITGAQLVVDGGYVAGGL